MCLGNMFPECIILGTMPWQFSDQVGPHVCPGFTSRLPKTLHLLKVTQLNLWDLLLVSTPLGAMSVQFIYHFEAWFGLLLLSGYPKL